MTPAAPLQDGDEHLAHSQAGALKSLATWMILCKVQERLSTENLLFRVLGYLAYTSGFCLISSPHLTHTRQVRAFSVATVLSWAFSAYMTTTSLKGTYFFLIGVGLQLLSESWASTLPSAAAQANHVVREAKKTKNARTPWLLDLKAGYGIL